MGFTKSRRGGAGGAGGGGFVVPGSATLPFADNTARNTWAAANLSDLIQNQTIVQVTGTPDDVWYLWSGDTDPATHDPADWTDVTPILTGPQGPQGIQGLQGNAGNDGADGTDGTNGTDGLDGNDGNDGWTPQLAAVTDGLRVVQQISGWIGGEGTPPATGEYVGATGPVTNIADAIDISGPAGISSAFWIDPVLDQNLATPPGSPSNGDRYIIAASATGAWLGQSGNVAEWDGTAWDFTISVEGMTTYIEDENLIYHHDGSSWIQAGGTGGITSVQAGDNITVDNTDPDNPEINVTGNFDQNRITGLPNELVGKATSPLTTVVGRVPKYGNTHGDLDAGMDIVGAGVKDLTLNSHDHIDDIYLPQRLRRYPSLPTVGYSSSATITTSNVNTYLNRFNIFDGTITSSLGLSVTFADAAALPTKTDFSDDDDTIVIANFNRLPVRLAIIPGSQVWRLNSGTITGDIDLPQFHYIQLSRQSGFTSQIYVMNFGVINFLEPGSSLTINGFSVPKDVEIPTTISGSQTIEFLFSNGTNVELDDWDILIQGQAGGVTFIESPTAMTETLKEGQNSVTFTVPTSRTLSQDGDFYEVSINYDSISPNVQVVSTNEWRIEARTADHPTQAKFKVGWLDGATAISSFNSSTIDSTAVYDGTNTQIGTGPQELSTFPSILTIPGVDAGDDKRLLMEIPGDMAVLENIIAQAGTVFQTVVYDIAHPLSEETDFNSITYTKDVNGVTKTFTLVYSRTVLLESNEGKQLNLQES